jgi:hypothetical protein
MNARWGLIVGLGCAAAVAALAILVRNPAALSPSISASGGTDPDRAGLDAESDDPGSAQHRRRAALSGPGSATPAAGRPKRLSEGGGDDAGGLLRRRLALPATGARVGATDGTRRQLGGSGSGSGGGSGGGVVGSLPVADESLRARDVPPTRAAPSLAGTPGGPGAAQAKGESDPSDPGNQPDPNAVPEVMYDSGDHVFDTVSRAEVSDVGPISKEAGTLSFWFQPEWGPNNRDVTNFIQLGDDGLQIIKDGTVLRFANADGSPLDGGGSASLGDWQAGEWRQVTMSWHGSVVELYVDGVQQVINGTWTPPDSQNDLRLYVGGAAYPNRSPVALGQLSYLMVLDRAATGAQIQQMFTSGGPPRR